MKKYRISCPAGSRFFDRTKSRRDRLPAPDRQQRRRSGLHPRRHHAQAPASARRRWEKLGQVAATLHVSLFEAVFSAAAAAQIGERHLAPLLEFCHFINRTEERVVREPLARC